MRRKLALLDVALAGILVLLGFRAREVWLSARQRETRVLGQTVRPEKMPPLPAPPPVAPLMAASYADVAIKMLFARDRNPTVIIDPVAAPPEKPMPALPVAYGTFFLGEPSIILAPPGGAQRRYIPGQNIGDFKLLAFDAQTVTFEWNGKKVERRMDEIMAKPSDAPKPGTPAPTTPAAPSSASVASLGSAATTGPGVDIGGGFRGCSAGDATPSGTVQNGLRKVEIATPFGKSCRWEPVK